MSASEERTDLLEALEGVRWAGNSRPTAGVILDVVTALARLMLKVTEEAEGGGSATRERDAPQKRSAE